MKRFGIKAREGVRISQGPKGSWLVYTRESGESKTIELKNPEGKVLNQVIQSRGMTSEELREILGLSAIELNESLQVLRLSSLIEEVSVQSIVRLDRSERKVADNQEVRSSNESSSFKGMKRIDKYTYSICDLSEYSWFTDSWVSKFVRASHSRLFIFSIALAFFSIWSFYHSPNKALGARITEDVFLETSIVEVFSIVLITQALTTLYKICVGYGKDYSSSQVRLKLMAGFHPVFEGEEDKMISKLSSSQSRWEYFTYIAAPQAMRAYLLSLSILLVYIGYPFATPLSQLWLKLLLINISVSIITFFWAVFPSPGTTSFKALEIYNIIPQKLVGISVRNVFRDISNKKRYRFVLIIIALLIITKVLYLLFFLLPEVIHEVPAVFGTWTPQITYVILVVMAIKFILFKYSPEANKEGSKERLANTEGAKRRKTRAQHESIGSNDSLFDRFEISSIVRQGKNKAVTMIAIFVLVVPYTSSVSGTAKIVQKMSLDINSTERETASVQKVYRSGPSTQIIRKGEVIMKLESPALESLISQAKDRIFSLQKTESILKTELGSLKTGSRFESSKNINETVVQNIADRESLRSEISSLERQVTILLSQVARYKSLADSGALSNIQYEDKVVELEIKQTMLRDVKSEYEKVSAELVRSKRMKKIDQALSLSEELNTTLDKLKSTQSDLNKERKELSELERRGKELLITSPFDSVIDSDTSLLLGKKVSYGDPLVSIRSVPSEEVIISVPEYDRGEIQIGDRVEVRLYSKINAILHGRVSSISPITTEQHDQEIVDVLIGLKGDLPSNFIGASGTGKIRTGWTCLLMNLVKPVARFVHVDLWSIMP